MKRLICIIFFGCIIFMVPPILNAAPLFNFPISSEQPDGTPVRLYVSGDEFYNWAHDGEGFTVLRHPRSGWWVYADRAGGRLVPTGALAGRDNPRSLGIRPGLLDDLKFIRGKRSVYKTRGLRSNTPNAGDLNNVVIFIRFSDESEFHESLSSFSSLFNGTGPQENTMQHYFYEISYGVLNVETTFYPVPDGSETVSYQDSHPRDYYRPANDQTNPEGYDTEDERITREQELLYAAATAVADQIPGDLDLDLDDDGYVDNVSYIIKGSPDGWADLLWPHKWSLYYTAPVYLNDAMVMTFNFHLSDTLLHERGVGVLSHEMFHSLGAPDLYSYENPFTTPVGPWDLMAHPTNPPQHPNVYLKYRYGGWIAEIPEITEDGVYTLNPILSPSNNSYRIASYYGDEYFVLEYRRKVGLFEGGLPGTGLVIYRIDPYMDGYGNVFGPPWEQYVFRQGGAPDSDGAVNRAALGTRYGRSTFNMHSDPYPFLSDGRPGRINIINIGRAEDTISFELSSGPMENNCGNEYDEDSDGLTDCEDPDCEDADDCFTPCVEDGNEPNNSALKATPVEPDTIIEDAVSVYGDDDVFVMEVCIGAAFRAELSFLDSEGDINIYLEDFIGGQYALSEGGSDTEAIDWVAEKNDFVYLWVKMRTPGGCNPYTLAYSLDRAACSETACQDRIDNDLDGNTDCDDADCLDEYSCAAVETDGDSGGEGSPSYCPGYFGSLPCCMTDDPCGLSGNGACDCYGACGWDDAECIYVPPDENGDGEGQASAAGDSGGGGCESLQSGPVSFFGLILLFALAVRRIKFGYDKSKR